MKRVGNRQVANHYKKQSNYYKKGNRPYAENQIRYLIWGEPVDKMDSRETLVYLGDYEIVPIYFQWSVFDLKVLQFLKSRKILAKLAAVYFQKRYKEVFLEHTETLFLSEMAHKQIPYILWKNQPQEMQQLHLSYTKTTFLEALKNMEANKQQPSDDNGRKAECGQRKQMTIVLTIPDECNITEFEEWLEKVQEQDLTRLALTDFIMLGNRQQKEACEQLLDVFYEQTGIPGSFYYSIKEYRRGMAERVYIDNSCERNIMFLDCFGVPVKEIGRANFYIDGAGTKTKGEIRKLESTGITCKSLRKYLDSTFLSKL